MTKVAFPVLVQDFVDYLECPDEEPALHSYQMKGFTKALGDHIDEAVEIAMKDPRVANRLRVVMSRAHRRLSQAPLPSIKHAGRLEKAPNTAMYPEIRMADVL